jgi:hypothetical protein
MAMMAKCPYCLGEVLERAQYCSRCGQEIPPDAWTAGRLAPSQSPESYRMRVGHYLKTGWEVFRQYPGGFVGFTLLAIVLSLALDQIPYVGPLINFVITMPLQVGPMIVAARLLQGKKPQFQEFFFGFHYFWPLFLMGLVVALLIVGGALPFAAAFFLMIGEASRGLNIVLLVSVFVLFILSIIVLYWFAPMLAVDRRVNFWPAMEMSRKTVQRNLAGVLGFLGVLVLVAAAGLLCLVVGILVAIPVINGTITAAYADIFGLQSAEY